MPDNRCPNCGEEKEVNHVCHVPFYLGTPIGPNDIKRIVSYAGGHFFDKDTMRFFRSRLLSTVIPDNTGWLFLTSERMGPPIPREYSIRHITPRGYIAGRETFPTAAVARQHMYKGAKETACHTTDGPTSTRGR